MQLIGMLDSPYVRRVAISLQLMGLRFEHQALSVFSTFEQFHAINPVVKAPTLVCDDGTVLMDSTLILEYARTLPSCQRTLMPSGPIATAQALHSIGLALAACEKSVQIIYEHRLRPEDKRHQPWLDRVTGQLQDALQAMEAGLAKHPLSSDASINQAGISTAVAWYFMEQTLPHITNAERYPGLAAFSAKAEQLPAFRAAPHGNGTATIVNFVDGR